MTEERQVEVPAEAVEAAYRSLDGEQLKWLATTPPERKAIALAALQAAAPSIRAPLEKRIAELEAEQCESCEDTGVYVEDMEWAPCGECFRGSEFTKLLKAHAKEVRQQAAQQERERVKAALLSDKAIAALWAHIPEGMVDDDAGPADWEARECRDAVSAALSTLDKEEHS